MLIINEQNSLNEVLSQEKTVLKEYAGRLAEVSDERFRKLLERHLVAQSKGQERLQRAMKKLHYLQPKPVPQSVIEAERKQILKRQKIDS